MFDISIITIGDEICIGQIVNTNAAWIAGKITSIGANVKLHSTIGDNRDSLIDELNRLLPISDLVILTGGLGPTHDDITKNVLCEYFGDDLVLHNDTLKYLKKIFSLRGYHLTERNMEQAYLPSRCLVLKNEVGTAPGMLFEEKGKFVISLPGVPAEMKYIMNDSVIPFIKRKIAERNDNVVLYKNLQTTGIPESKLADMIGEPKEFLGDGSLAFLPSYRGVKLRIGVSGKNFETAREKLKKIEKVIFEKAGGNIFSADDESLVSKVGSLLSERNLTVAVAESCTGGLLGAEFTSISGSSVYFSGGVIAYSNEIKEKILNVSKDSLVQFGAVSEQVAFELARNVRDIFKTDVGIGITGIAGPTGGTEEKPVGTVFIGLAFGDNVKVKRFVFSTEREVNRERAVGTALTMLLNELQNNQ
jgi:nicotinamide-nucleotide amidase